MIKRLIYFFKEGIFQRSESDYPHRLARWAVRQYKLLFYTAKGLMEHDTFIRSAGLTFYTLMSLVPIFALVFAIVKGFGLTEMLTDNLHELLPQFPDFVNYVVEFANNALERTKGGVVASIGIVVLFWSVIKVFSNVESAFNNIWEVKKPRSIARQFTDYVAVIFVAPILWLVSNAMTLYVSDWLDLHDTLLYEIFSHVVSIMLIWLMFTFIYTVIPNTKVRFTKALTAGIVAGTVFIFFQWGYVYLQRWMTSYNAIYGSFAALPLFLIWMQTSWQIVLVGGELAFAYQNIAKFEQERRSLYVSQQTRRQITLAVMMIVARSFVDSQGPVSSEEVSERLNLPLRIVRDVTFELERAQLIVAVRNDQHERINYYIPGKDVHKITLYDVISTVEEYGSDGIEIDSQELRKIGKLLDGMKAQAFDSPLNQPIINL